MSGINDPESLFNESKGNEYDLTDESDEEAIEKIEDAADFTSDFMRVNKSVQCGRKTYVIKNQKYQSISYRFELKPGNEGSCELSTPTGFSGDVRMWVTNSKGNKVWANVYDLSDVDFDGRALFEYLGGEDPNVEGFDQRSVARFFGDEETSEDSDTSDSDEEAQSFEPDEELPF
jgi:hypothetical protein